MQEATIILIPGLLCDAYVWEPLIQVLGGRALIADLTTQESITQMARDCLALAEGPLAVTGHSMGARVAMEMAHLAPQRLARLALLDTGIAPLREGEVEKRAEVVRLAYEEGMAALAERWLPGMVWPGNQGNSALMTQLRAMVLRQTPESHERQIGALVARPDASGYIGAIRSPTLLMVGRFDAWSPVTQHEHMCDLLPNARLEIIDDAGHFAPVEQPEAVAGPLADFLLGDES